MMHQPLLVSSILEHAARNHADTEIVSRRVEGDLHRYTYADAACRSRQLAAALLALGVTPGARVATLAWNTYRHVELFFAVSGIGAICHTVNPRLFEDQVVYILNHSEAEIVFLDITFLKLVEGIASRLTAAKQFVLLCDKSSMSASKLANVGNYEDLLDSEIAGSFSWPELDEETACGLCYTSGTTGNPKGVLYSQRSTVLHAMVSVFPDTLGLSAMDVVLPIVPMFHVNAWGFPYSAPMVGATLILPGPALDGKSIYELCEATGVTLAAGVPTVWMGLLDHARKEKSPFTSLRCAVIGGSAASASLIQELAVDRKLHVIHSWGMTELSPIGTVNQVKRKHLSLELSDQLSLHRKQGREVFGVEMRLVGANGEAVARDGVEYGRLLVRGPWVVEKYFGSDVAAGPAGWFDTGDIATIDSDGFMEIVDRTKDVIKSGGEWISSIELENVAMKHPSIQEAAAIGIPHAKWVERPLLVVAPKPGKNIKAQEMLDFFDGRVAPWWKPDAVVVVDELPHGPTGKLLKLAVREQFKDYQVLSHSLGPQM